MSELPRVEFGNPLLRVKSAQLSEEEILSPKIQFLIKRMRQTLHQRNHGIGLAAPQVGRGIALSVISIRPTKHRPRVEPFDLVIINPQVIRTFGSRVQLWEGCLSAGASGLFAKTPRYKKVEVAYVDETTKTHTRQFSGLQAQVLQHEIDHLNGVLFMDHVKDPKTYMTLKEYKKRIVTKK